MISIGVFANVSTDTNGNQQYQRHRDIYGEPLTAVSALSGGRNGDIMTKEIWVQFKDMESYRENEVKLCTLLRETPGECTAFVYIKDIKNVRELHTYSFDEKQIELLNDTFGEENVRYQEREIKKEIKWNRPTEVPKIKQLLPCMHDMYAVMRDDDGYSYKCKVLMYALCNDGEIYPLYFDHELGISPLDEAVYDVCGYELEGGEVYSPEGGKPDEQR